MRNYSLAEQARTLNNEGWNYRAIATKLSIKPSTVSSWCGRITDKRIGAVIESFQNKRQKLYNKDKIPKFDIDKNKAKILAALLYWCEGSKYPASNQMSFTSSDSELLQLFIFMLRKGFEIDESKFRIWLQIHEDQNRDEMFKYWSKLLSIPIAQFYKPKITKRRGGKYRQVYYGTCSLRYHDYSIIIRIMGLYKRFWIKVRA